MENHSNEHFYNKDWFLWLSLILFAPLGIFLLWKRRRYTTVSRVVVTCVFAFLFLIPFGLFRTGNMTAQNRPYEQTEFARVSWTNHPLFNLGRWFKRTANTNPVPPPSGVQLKSPLPGTTPATQPAASPATGTNPTPATVPGGQASPSPATQPAASGWKALQDKIFDLTNVERQKNGVQPLVYNAAVEKYAVAKSTDMATNNYFDHKSPTNGYFNDIWKRDGFQFSAGAENIYTMTDSRGFANRDINSLAQTIVSGWMGSTGHRQNILNPNLKELGVGVADKDNKLYATQLFHTK